jgi:sensor c-di-GMP phosphodiesterase-like protein
VNVLSLPLNIVKIDKSLVWAYFNEGNDLLTRIMMAFENETFSLVVEGVETEEMAEELANLGCRYEQGYFYSKPIPEYAFIKYVTDQHY